MSAAATMRRHWDVLKDSWAAETEASADRKAWRETQFLPAALEVMETPPNPLGRILLWILIAFIAVAILWSIVAKVDVVAIAPGKIIAADRNALVQAADGGVVRAIYVRDGQQVRKGQLLVALDPTTAVAEEASAGGALLTARIDAARARSVLAGLDGRSSRFEAPEGITNAAIATEKTLIESGLSAVASKVAGLRQQSEEAKAQFAGANAETARLVDTLPLLSERVAKRKELADKGLSSKLLQLELEQQKMDHEHQITVQRETANRAKASLAGIAEQIAMAHAEARRDTLADLDKAESEIRTRESEMTKAGARSRLQTLRSPVDGTVQQLAVYTVGAVLKPADPILVVVPKDAKLVVEANVLNRDMGFVRGGQKVTVKLDAFPFTRYGTISGRLIQISRDAIQDEKLGPVYQARILIDVDRIDADGLRIPLSPGLSAIAEIRTGERRVVDFLLSPLERRANETGRER